MTIRRSGAGDVLLLRPGLRAGGRLLVFSDSPEEVRAHGAVYRETAARPFRIFLHHVNRTGATAGMYICVENLAPGPRAVTARATGAAWGTGYAMVGARAVRDYLKNPNSYRAPLPAGGWARWGVDRLTPGALFSGAYNFDPEGPVRITVALVASGHNPNPAGLPLLPADGVHARGTFSHSTRQALVEFRTSMGAAGLQLGNNPRWERPAPWNQVLAGEFEPGLSPDGQVAELLGNYGVIYRVAFRVVNDAAAPRTVEWAMRPMGGEFCGAADFSGNVVIMPRPLPGPEYEWVAWQAALAPGEERLVPLRWMPAGGSNLPVRIILQAQ